jgi:trans-aconitate 2-methyltransferase
VGDPPDRARADLAVHVSRERDGSAPPCADAEAGAPCTEVDWDAAAYERLSDPQFEWGRRVLDRLELRGDERVLDAGCGTGRLTALLAARLPRGHVIAVDRSPAMLEEARRNLAHAGERVTFVEADLTTLELACPVDAIFSTATFHWIREHGLLFRTLFAALAPGGRLEAQCGGGPNLARLRARIATVTAERFARHFRGWQEPWLFSGPDEAAERLRQAGFADVATSLEPAPTRFESSSRYAAFLATVVVRPHLERLPSDTLRRAFLDELVAAAVADGDPFVLDYWRLNLRGRRPRGGSQPLRG